MPRRSSPLNHPGGRDGTSRRHLSLRRSLAVVRDPAVSASEIAVEAVPVHGVAATIDELPVWKKTADLDEMTIDTPTGVAMTAGAEIKTTATIGVRGVPSGTENRDIAAVRLGRHTPVAANPAMSLVVDRSMIVGEIGIAPAHAPAPVELVDIAIAHRRLGAAIAHAPGAQMASTVMFLVELLQLLRLVANVKTPPREAIDREITTAGMAIGVVEAGWQTRTAICLVASLPMMTEIAIGTATGTGTATATGIAILGDAIAADPGAARGEGAGAVVESAAGRRVVVQLRSVYDYYFLLHGRSSDVRPTFKGLEQGMRSILTAAATLGLFALCFF